MCILRKKNEEEKKFINFNKMRLLECCNMEMVDTLTIFKNVGQDESMHEMCMAEGCEMPIDELYNITNGHDLCKILGFTFKSGKGEMGEQRIRDVMLYNKNIINEILLSEFLEEIEAEVDYYVMMLDKDKLEQYFDEPVDDIVLGETDEVEVQEFELIQKM